MTNPDDQAAPSPRHLELRKEGGVLTITLNRPEARNALNLPLFEELRRALILAQIDPQVQVAVITGAGAAFCSGADLKEVADHHASAQSRAWGAYASAEAADALYRQIVQMDKVVVSMVNGAAYAGGAVIAACSDIAVASDRAVFCIPEALVGIADQLSTTWLEASIGLARTKMMVLTAQEVTAAEAQAMGLVAVVAPHVELAQRTREVISRVLRTAPGARAAYKHLLNDRLPKTEQRHIVTSHLSAESQEGADAFREKRPAAWIPR